MTEFDVHPDLFHGTLGGVDYDSDSSYVKEVKVEVVVRIFHMIQLLVLTFHVFSGLFLMKEGLLWHRELHLDF